MDDALRADVHVGAGGHLTVLADTEGVHAFVVIATAVVGDDHAVGHHHPGCAGVGGEQAHGVPAVHDEGLLLRHFAQIAHHEAVLCPVLEDGAVSAVGDEFLRMLRDGRVQVVLDHQHDGRRLGRPCGVMVDGPGVHRVIRHEPIHVDAAKVLQLLGEFRSELRVLFGWEIAQGICQGQLLLLRGEDVLSNGSMWHLGVAFPRGRQNGGQAFRNGGLEIGEGRSGRGGGVHLRGLWGCGRGLSLGHIRRGSVCNRWCSNSRVCGGIVR